MQDKREIDSICDETREILEAISCEWNVDISNDTENHRAQLIKNRQALSEYVDECKNEITILRDTQVKISSGSASHASLREAENKLKKRMYELEDLIENIEVVVTNKEQFIRDEQAGVLDAEDDENEIDNLASFSEFTRNTIRMLDRFRFAGGDDTKQLTVELPEYYRQMLKNSAEPEGGRYTV